MSITEEIFQALKDYLVANLTEANWVTLAHIDERADDSSESSFPIVTINLYDMNFDNVRRVGGFVKERVDLGDNTYSMKPLPIPVNFHFQLDALCNKLRDSWELNEAITIILGRRWSNFTLSGGNKLYMIPETMTNLFGIEDDNIHRATFRFYVQAWLVDPTTPTVVNQVLKLELEYQEEGVSDIVEVTG